MISNNNEFIYIKSIESAPIETTKIDSNQPIFDEHHITMDEGEVKEILKGEIATYPNVNSCFTITFILSDGNMVGAHLVSPAADEQEKRLREEKDVKEPNQILPTIKKMIGDRTIKQLIVAGSLHESKEATGIKKVPDKEGKKMIDQEYTYKTNSWKTKDLIDKFPSDSSSMFDNDGPNLITAFIACYFENNLEKYDDSGNGFKALNCITFETALITIANEKEGVQVKYQDQNKFNEKANDTQLSCKVENMIQNEDDYHAWLGAKEYLEWGSI